MVKNLLANARDMGWIPGWEDPVEEEMAPYSSALAWKIPWAEEPGGLQSMGSLRVRHDGVTEYTHIHIHTHTHNSTSELTMILLKNVTCS